MPESRSRLDDTTAFIHRPACPRCDAHMMLARIMPAGLGFNLRTFECPKCDHVHEMVVETNAFGAPITPRKTG